MERMTEQQAFEQWAKSQNLDLSQHPLHYLFLNPVTDTARQAWKAALKYQADQSISET